MAAVATLTGTATQFATDPTDQGQTVENRNVALADLDARTAPLTDQSFFQEVNTFINEAAVAQGIAPLGVIVRLHQMLGQMLAFRNGG